MSGFGFEIVAKDSGSHARVTRIHTPHGDFLTPAFMPVGTSATVKGLTAEQLWATGSRIVLANAYHLHLRPGERVVAELGGLHAFMGWSGPILTDSGGFQVFSLAKLNRIDDDGVFFRSHVDGAMVPMTPERSMEIQNRLGADIIMAFDQCPPGDAPPGLVVEAVQRTVRWAGRCRQAHARADQWLFGVGQGGLDPALRSRCQDQLEAIGFDGYAIGGLSVGEPLEKRNALLSEFAPTLPEGRPRYLMGVGRPADIVAAAALGIDLFDCVMPTRQGRNSWAFVRGGHLKLRNERHQTSDEPLERECDCYTCRHHSRGYLRHLFVTGEMLGPILVSLHNVRFYQRMMERIRQSIAGGDFSEVLEEFGDISTRRKEKISQ